MPGSFPLYATRERRTLLFINHRSLADFFLHDCITDYQSSFLSRSPYMIFLRMLVSLLFPCMGLSTYINNTVWYFVRGGRGDDLETYANG